MLRIFPGAPGCARALPGAPGNEILGAKNGQKYHDVPKLKGLIHIFSFFFKKYLSYDNNSIGFGKYNV